MRHFIEFMISGDMPVIIESRKLPESLPKNTIAYRFYDLDKKTKKYSGWTYFGIPFSLEEINALVSEEKELFKKFIEKYSKTELTMSFLTTRNFQEGITKKGWTRFVKVCDGHWYPLKEEDAIWMSAKTKEINVQIRDRIKEELLSKGERHPRVSLKSIEEMKILQIARGGKLYAKVGRTSYYAWVNEDREVVSVQVVKRRR